MFQLNIFHLNNKLRNSQFFNLCMHSSCCNTVYLQQSCSEFKLLGISLGPNYLVTVYKDGCSKLENHSLLQRHVLVSADISETIIALADRCYLLGYFRTYLYVSILGSVIFILTAYIPHGFCLYRGFTSSTFGENG